MTKDKEAMSASEVPANGGTSGQQTRNLRDQQQDGWLSVLVGSVAGNAQIFVEHREREKKFENLLLVAQQACKLAVKRINDVMDGWIIAHQYIQILQLGFVFF